MAVDVARMLENGSNNNTNEETFVSTNALSYAIMLTNDLLPDSCPLFAQNRCEKKRYSALKNANCSGSLPGVLVLHGMAKARGINFGHAIAIHLHMA